MKYVLMTKINYLHKENTTHNSGVNYMELTGIYSTNVRYVEYCKTLSLILNLHI